MVHPSLAPQNIVVIVPGFMGSKLRHKATARMVWGDFDKSVSQRMLEEPLGLVYWLKDFFNLMQYPVHPEDNPLEAVAMLDEVAFFPPLFQQQHYGRLSKFLGTLGYSEEKHLPEEERTVYEFYYDWRQDNRRSAEELKRKIEYWIRLHPNAEVWIIAHSQGGLVARWYIEKLAGKEKVSRLHLMASPWDGTTASFRGITSGVDVFLRGSFTNWWVKRRMREILRTFPGIYQLLPHARRILRFATGEANTPYDDRTWIKSEREQQLLADALAFNTELADLKSSIPTFCYIGRGQSTLIESRITHTPKGDWDEITWIATSEGDGTIARESAKHPWVPADHCMTVITTHTDIYVDTLIGDELASRLRTGERAVLITSSISLTFAPSQTSYKPGEVVEVQARLQDNAGQPIRGAQIDVTLTWRNPLPGNGYPDIIPLERDEMLQEHPEVPGLYAGSFAMWLEEGYWELRGKFIVPLPDEPNVELTELILVEEPIPDLVDEQLLMALPED